MTTSACPAVLLICADSVLTRRFITELVSAGGPHQTPLATSLSQARKILTRWTPQVILLDESSLEADSAASGASAILEQGVAALIEHAPVIVVAAARHQESLTFLIVAGAVDLVARTGNFVPVAAGLVARRASLAGRASGLAIAEPEPDRDFGQLLRHEVNNPLTGILGNAELLLQRREGLPAQAVARLETIAELAVRLRETIRHLSDCWESRNHPARMI